MERIEECLSFLLGKAYQQVNQEAKRRLAPHGVTTVQYALLKVLWERDDQSGVEIGERLQLDSATITGVLDRLERAGFVARRADPRDRRVNRIVLTAQGRAAQAALEREMAALNAAWFGRLSTGDADRLRAALGELGRVGVPA